LLSRFSLHGLMKKQEICSSRRHLNSFLLLTLTGLGCLHRCCLNSFRHLTHINICHFLSKILQSFSKNIFRRIPQMFFKNREGCGKGIRNCSCPCSWSGDKLRWLRPRFWPCFSRLPPSQIQFIRVILRHR